jgi:hypothetical protein
MPRFEEKNGGDTDTLVGDDCCISCKVCPLHPLLWRLTVVLETCSRLVGSNVAAAYSSLQKQEMLKLLQLRCLLALTMALCLFAVLQAMSVQQKEYETQRHALFFKEESCKQLYKDHVDAITGGR